ncbi:MAG: hypothetical protein U9N81_08210 [Bacillota bacterium]|nr:hypothetical protein [Bacillota bacterium]
MQINWIHREDQSGEKLVQYFEENWESVNCGELELYGEKYMNIIASKDQTTKFTCTINDYRGLRNCQHSENIRDILQVNGIQWQKSEGEIANRSYEVLVYDQKTISIKQTIIGRSTPSSKYLSEQQCEKIAALAKRMVYLLGLDFAMVNIIVTGRQKVRVEHINPSPDLREKDLLKLLQVMEGILSKRLKDQNAEVVMGADPEFMMVNTRSGKMIPASNFFPREGLVGCDNIRVPSRQQRPVAEVRPKPEMSPLDLSANIKQALLYAGKMVPYKNVKWIAGSQPFSGLSIGGHIHFSKISLNNALLRALDNYVTIPLFLIENQDSAVKRRKRYGTLADFRTKDYGGFEYRTPGSWLVSPEITRAVLCLAKVVSTHYNQLGKNIFLRSEAQVAFYNGDQIYFSSVFEALWKDIMELPTYEMYREELRLVPEMIREKSQWDEKSDIRKAWNIPLKSSKTYRGRIHDNNTSHTNNSGEVRERTVNRPTSARTRPSTVTHQTAGRSPSRTSANQNRYAGSMRQANSFSVSFRH